MGIDINKVPSPCYVLEEDIKDIAAHERRKRVAYFAAESQWWFDTIGEHFKLPLSAQMEDAYSTKTLQ